MPAVNRYYSSTAIDTTLSFSITSSDLTLVVGSTSGFPTSYPYTLAIGYDLSNEELVTIIGASGTTLTVGTTVAGGANIAGRGVDGTSDQAHAAGEAVKHVISARDMTESQAHIAAEAGAHGITGSFVGTTDAQALTNKTITSPAISNPTISGTITGAVVTSANIVDGTIVNADINASAAISASKLSGVVTPTSSDVLTNKTLTSPIITGGTINSGVALTVDSTELNKLDGATATTAELNYVTGVTSAIQTQLDGKVTTPGAWSSWTPTLGNLTLGSGSTATYKYNQVGKTVNFSIDITFAGTSSGNGSTITFTLPVTASGNYKGVFASGGYATASGSSPFTIFGLLSSGSTTVMRLNYPVSGSFGAGITYGSFGPGSSITAGAYLQIAGTYETA